MNIRGRNKVDANFNMSSMTDIVFLLLIFFMLTSTLVTVNAIDVLLPKAGGKTESKAGIAVSITKDSEFFIEGESIDKSELESVVIKKFSGGEAKTLVIRGDENVPYKNVMHVIDIANKNKIKMILAVKGM